MPARPSRSEYVSLLKAAEILQVSKDTLIRLEKKGKISPIRGFGGKRLYSKYDIDFLTFYLSKPQLFS